MQAAFTTRPQPTEKTDTTPASRRTAVRSSASGKAAGLPMFLGQFEPQTEPSRDVSTEAPPGGVEQGALASVYARMPSPSEGIASVENAAAIELRALAPWLPAEAAKALRVIVALQQIKGRAEATYQQAEVFVRLQLLQVHVWVERWMRANTPSWFGESVFPILLTLGEAVVGTMASVIWELFRDFVFPAWGVLTRDLPDLWKGLKKMVGGASAGSPLEVVLGQNDMLAAVLSAASRFEWALGMWLMIIGAVAGGGTGTAVGGGGAAAVSGGLAAPEGAAAGGATVGALGEAAAWVFGEGTGGVLALASFLSDLERLFAQVPSYFLEKDPERKNERFDDLMATAFRAGTTVVFLVLAFVAVRFGKPVGDFVRDLLQRPDLKKAANNIEAAADDIDLTGFFEGFEKPDWPISTPAIELEGHAPQVGSKQWRSVPSPTRGAVDDVIDGFRKVLKIDRSSEWLGSIVHVADEASYDRYVAGLLRHEHPHLSESEVLELTGRLPAFFSRENGRILLRSGFDPSQLSGVLTHETSHLLFRPWVNGAKTRGFNEGFAQMIAERLSPGVLKAYPEVVNELTPVVEKIGLEKLFDIATKGKRSELLHVLDDALGKGEGEVLLGRLGAKLERDMPVTPSGVLPIALKVPSAKELLTEGGGGHAADFTLYSRRGNKLFSASAISGGMTGEVPDVRTRAEEVAGHTEPKIIRAVLEFAKEKGIDLEGAVLHIAGDLPPCPSCQGAMNYMDGEFGVAVRYTQRDSGEGLWESAPKLISEKAYNIWLMFDLHPE